MTILFFLAVLSNFNLSFLKSRRAFLRAVRDFFDERGYLEVDSPALLPFAPPDSALDALAVTGLKGSLGFLATSPEFGLKQYAAAQDELPELSRIYEICHSFRDENIDSRWHTPEFLMLEWYNWLTDLAGFSSELELLITRLAAAGFSELGVDGNWPVFSIKEFCLKQGIGWSFETQQDYSRRLGFLSDNEVEIFSYLSVAVIEPALPEGWVWVEDYPAFLSSLAQVDPREKDICRRRELYWSKIEIANLYVEETDPNNLATFWQKENEKRKNRGKPEVGLSEGFLESQAKLNRIRKNNDTGIGAALGLDRLFAVLSGQNGLVGNSPYGSVFRKND